MTEEKPSALDIAAGEIRHGFIVKRCEFIPEIRTMAYEMEHLATSAQVLHLHCEDRENLFAIGFRTPPPDSTGVPHILEHAVLAGSHRYPLKDVFNELMKGSLQTFINAFTYPDKTIYPVASQTKADFYNLARVYADLVFRPRLLRETFLQEGHHLEFADPEDIASELLISGIVYNEMKGAYSSPDTLMFKALQEGIFPGGCYHHDSGGNPAVIPTLTYEALKNFHERYYAPSNARFFLYGNIPTLEHLAFLEELLTDLPPGEVNSTIGLQERRTAPIRLLGTYPLAKEEGEARKTVVNMAWLLSDNTDYETSLLLEIAAGALVGTAASPLKRALIDSGLGEDLSPVTGIERDLRELVFAVGLRGTDEDRTQEIEELIIAALRKVVEKGFDRELIQGIIHQVEFHGREIVRGNYPYGIVLMGRVFHSWLYDGDPLAGLNLPRLMTEIRRKWEANPRLFEEVVETWLLDNPHRVTSTLKPSKTKQEEEQREFRERMARLKATFQESELQNIKEESLRLKRFQSEPDPPEAARSLPRLKLSEISPEVERIPTEESVLLSVPVLRHEIFTNGIGYLDLAFDVAHIPEELQPYLPLLGKITLNMGAAGLSYEDMAKRIALVTGGISYQLGCGLAIPRGSDGGKGPWQKMIIRCKALYRNLAEAGEIMAALLTQGDLQEEGRMKDLVLEKKNSLYASVIPAGHIFARRSAASGLTLPAWRDEQWHGRTQLRLVNHTAQTFHEGKDDLREKLSSLKRLVFTRSNLTVNLTACREGLGILDEAARTVLGQLPPGGQEEIPPAPPLGKRSLACSIPSQVSYVAQVFAAPAYDDPLAPNLAILARFLSSDYLYKHIRVQGGAYGGMTQYEQLSGIFAFLSYRDPHIGRTLEVYRQAAQFIGSYTLSQDELEKAIIGTIGSLDKPMDPAGRGLAALIRYFSGLTDEKRAHFRRQVLAADPTGLRQTAERYFAAARRESAVAVYGAEEELRRARREWLEDGEIEPLL